MKKIILLTTFIALMLQYSYCQNNVVMLDWVENIGIQSGTFGTPSVLDGNGDLFRAGQQPTANGLGADAVVQMFDTDGHLNWSLNLSNATSNIYEPSQIIETGTILYVIGTVTYTTSGDKDVFISKCEKTGSLEWIQIDQVANDDIPIDLVEDPQSGNIYFCGTTDRNQSFDLLYGAYASNGTKLFATTKDYNGNMDGGAKIFYDNGYITINGSSQTTNIDWDIVSWLYDKNGNFINEERNGALSAASDEVKDGSVSNGFVTLTGRSFLNGLSDFKVLCYDSNNQLLWEDTFDKAGLTDEGLAVASSNQAFYSAGYITKANGTEDAFVRKYSLGGNLLWSQEIDIASNNDRGVDVLEDNQGNLFVLCDALVENQYDVYLYYLNGSTGAVIWQELIKSGASSDEHGVSIQSTIQGEIVVTYTSGGIATSSEYNYEELTCPIDQEPFSTSSFYIKNGGQVKYKNGSAADDIKYYDFGFNPVNFYKNDGFGTVIRSFDSDTTTSDTTQRIDFHFIGGKAEQVGQVQEYQRANHLNLYQANESFERQPTFDVISYPGLYQNINAFFSSNSEGVKMTFVLESGADLNDIAIEIQGASSLNIAGTELKIGTFRGDLTWLPPFSYQLNTTDPRNDYCIDYVLQNSELRFTTTCELQYPYVIQIKRGIGKTQTTTAIDNMDWSTFYGGDGFDFASDMAVDANNNLFIAGFTESDNFPLNAGVNPSDVNGKTKGLLIKFNKDAEIEWATIIEGTFNVHWNGFRLRGVDTYDNISSWPDEEVHVVGEYEGTLNSDIDDPSISTNAFQQSSTTATSSATELFFASFKNSDGSRLIISPFGGAKSEKVYGLDISSTGMMYFVGSTKSTGGISNTSPPSTHTFPVYNPLDGSYFQASHPNPGNNRGFVTAIDLSTYQLAYSSIITKDTGSSNTAFEAIYDITLDTYTSYCGKGLTYARLGKFDPSQTMFASQLNQSNSEWPKITYFSSVASVPLGNVYFGLDYFAGNNETVMANPNLSQYGNTNGEGFLLRITEASVVWKTYFGQQTNQHDAWSNGTGMSNVVDLPYGRANYPRGRGQLEYSSTTSTLFAAASAKDGNVETKSKGGFFLQSSNASGSAYAKEDLYLASFSYKSSAQIADYFNWGTMYGGNIPGAGLATLLSRDYLAAVTSYVENGDAFVVTCATSYSLFGTTTNSSAADLDKYPVAQPPNPNAWYKKDSYNLATDIVITRFNVTTIDNGLSTEEVDQKSYLQLFPNPTSGRVKVVSEKQEIESIRVYDLQGRELIYRHFSNGSQLEEVDLSQLRTGIYIIQVNELYTEKIIKH